MGIVSTRWCPVSGDSGHLEHSMNHLSSPLGVGRFVGTGFVVSLWFAAWNTVRYTRRCMAMTRTVTICWWTVSNPAYCDNFAAFIPPYFLFTITHLLSICLCCFLKNPSGCIGNCYWGFVFTAHLGFEQISYSTQQPMLHLYYASSL